MLYILIPFVVLLIIYLFFENKENFNFATFLKVTVSAYIALISIYYTVTVELNVFTILISLGLILAVPADFFLQYIKTDSKKYKKGIVFFSLMHLSLLISFYTKYSFNYLDLVVLAVILSILFIFQKSEKWDLGTEKTLLSIYSFFVALMASKAISIAITIKSIHAILIGLGGLCFIVSDIVLGVWSYYSNKD